MPSTNPNKVVTNSRMLSTDEVSSIEQYWTLNQMESAQPIPLPTVFIPRQFRKSLRYAPTKETGLVVSEPLPPDTITGHPTSLGFNTRLVDDLSVSPYAVVGKLFMTFNNNNYVGTGWVIGERTIFTAGHCVHDKMSGWATNVLFRAQFNNGADAGSWVLPSLASLEGWTADDEGDGYEFDMGMGIATTPVRPTTGKAGWLANLDQIQGQIKSIGYPAQNIIPGYDFNGQRMWECDGDFIPNSEARYPIENILAMQNNMTGGCSGGPGMYERSNQLYAMWVNSFRLNTEPNILRSPYFTTNFLNLIQWMKDNGGDR